MPPKKRTRADTTAKSTATISSYFKAADNKKERNYDEAPPTKQGCPTPNTDQSPPTLVSVNKLQAEAKLWAGKLGAGSIGSSWMKILSPEFKKEYFGKLMAFVEADRRVNTVYPPAVDVFSWTTACQLEEVKVVILGQDPYHGEGQAHGLCFSVRPGITPPPSLVNMYKELTNDIAGFTRPDHGCLEGWAKQGVLLLNACLTVRKKQPNSHAGQGWEKLTDAVVNWLNRNCNGLVFILWGAYAQKKGACIDKKRHLVLTSVHPSPLSANKGFFGCNHFSKANDYLVQEGGAPIDWAHLPGSL